MPASRNSPATSGPCSRRCQWLLCALLSLGGLILTALLTRQFWQDQQTFLRHQFEHLTEERFSRLAERLKERQRDLDSVRRFFENSDQVNRAEFQQFTLPLLSDHLALSWAPLLQVDAAFHQEQLQAFSQHAQTLVGNRFQLREADLTGNLQPLQVRERYFPLLFSVSRSIADLPLGLDMASPGPRRDALEEALSLDQVGSSAILRLASGAEEDRLGLLFVAPVRAQPSRHPRNAEAPLLGALFSAISLRQLLEEGQTTETLNGLAVELYDLEQTASPPLYRLGKPAPDSPLQASRELRSGHWHYRLVLRPTALLIRRQQDVATWGVALAGGGLSLLLGTLLFVLLSQRQRALALVERRTAELESNREALRISEERWTLALDGIGDGVWDWDLLADRLYFSPTWKAMLGYREDEIGDGPDEWRSRIHPEDSARCQHALHEHLAGRTPLYRCEKRLRCKDGSWLWLLARGKVVERLPNGQPRRIIGTHVDISARKALELELRTLTITDPLTGIYNRRYCLDHLETELARRARTGRGLSLIMLDIDHFKRINDGYGHSTGDQVLQELCRRIGARLRRTDMFCRIGGEEFVIVCPETGHSQAAHLAEVLRQLVQDSPFAGVGRVTASFGVSSARDGEHSERLLQRTDRALYAAKQSGRNRVCCESEELSA